MYELFIYAYLRRDEGDHRKCLWCNPTYGFSDIKSLSAKLSFMPILFNGALANSTLRTF
jgi:hypothetical protein